MSLLPRNRTLRQPSRKPTLATARFGSLAGDWLGVDYGANRQRL
jgi:hypothetical protein